MNYLALDFGGSSVKYGVVNGDTADISHNGKEPAPLGSVEEFVDTVGKIYDSVKNEVQGIGISLPGNVDPVNGVLYGNGVYCELYGKSIIGLLEEYCPVPVAVENDGKCGALSEAWKGALSDVNDGTVIILGSGIAGGLIKDRKIHSGMGFNAGELSYVITNSDELGLFGTAFMNCAILGITYKLCKAKNLDLGVQDSAPVMQLFESMYADRFPVFEEKPAAVKADGRQFFQWVEEQDEAAVRIYQECTKALAILIFNVQAVYAPEKIVIGGGLSNYEKLIPDTQKVLEQIYAAQNTLPAMRSAIVRSSYTDECNLLGATYNLMLRNYM